MRSGGLIGTYGVALLGGFPLAGMAVSTAHASAQPRLVKTNGIYVTGLGSYRTFHSLSPTLGGTVKAFGVPASRRADGELGCTVRWPRAGLIIGFGNLSGQPENPCADEVAKPQIAYLTGVGRWRTTRGLRIGDSLARLRALYPKAYPLAFHWRLVVTPYPVGAFGRRAVLSAYLTRGRVSTFRAWIGAAGE